MVMLHQAEVRVDTALEGGTLGMPGFMRLRYLVIFQESAIHIAFCAVGNVNPARLENNSKILDSLSVMLKKDFFGVQYQPKLLMQIRANDRQQ